MFANKQEECGDEKNIFDAVGGAVRRFRCRSQRWKKR